MNRNFIAGFLWTGAALLLVGSAESATRSLLPLARTQYASPAGATVRIEFTSNTRSLVRNGKSLKSLALPNPSPAPFASVDVEGNLVIAVPSLTPPGRYSVAFDLTVGEEIHSGTLALIVGPAAQVPPSSGTPVILLNGWQPPSLFQFSTCPTSAPDGSQPFGALPKTLTVFTTFFDNCVECPDCAIEALGAKLGQRIDSLTYTDGTPVPQVDLVGHSMGGLIMRSYLAGKAAASASFAPPANPKVRKAIFIGTPHFGSFLATTLGTQSVQLRVGSQFQWDLNRWNQGSDDLREVDALAIAGNSGSGGKSDGVVAVTSASFGRTRVIDACHIDGSAAFLLLCGSSQGIASSAESLQIVTSFLAGADAWTTIGHAPSQDAVLSKTGGRFAAVYDAANVAQTNVSGITFAGVGFTRNSENQVVFYNDSLPAGSGSLSFTWQGRNNQTAVTVEPGGGSTILLKSPPAIAAVRLAAGSIATLNIAPGSLISIFGIGLASTPATSSYPWPAQLADVTVTANGQSLPLLYAGPAQINAYFPPELSGLVTLKLTNSLGQHSLNVMTANATPALFSADSSGTGVAAAIHAVTGRPVSSSDPAVPGEYIELYGTGFGSTHPSDGYAVTNLTPRLSVGGVPATVTFCGIPAGGIGLYQLNFVVPDNLSQGIAAEIVLGLGSYTANTVTLPIR